MEIEYIWNLSKVTDSVWDDSFSKMMPGFVGEYETWLHIFSMLEFFKLHI